MAALITQEEYCRDHHHSRNTIAVTGATGQLGRLVVEQLKTQLPAEHLVALVRTPAKAAGLGIAVREADYTRPETLAAALAGIDTLLLISSPRSASAWPSTATRSTPPSAPA